jgi:hypothetical protein
MKRLIVKRHPTTLVFDALQLDANGQLSSVRFAPIQAAKLGLKPPWPRKRLSKSFLFDSAQVKTDG